MTVKAALVYDENSGEWADSALDNDAVGDYGDDGSLMIVRDGGRLNAYALPGASPALLRAVHQASRTYPGRGLSAYEEPIRLAAAVGRLLEVERARS